MAASFPSLRTGFVRVFYKINGLPSFSRSIWVICRNRNFIRKIGYLSWSRSYRFWYSTLTVPPLIGFSLFGSSSNVQPEVLPTPKASEEDLALEKADELFDNNAIDELYEVLIKFKESDKAGTMWRLARAARNKAERAKDGNEKKKFTYEALEYAKKSVELDDRDFACHKWYAITVSNVGDFEGTKTKIQNAYTIRDHFQKAVDLNPTDATSRHLLGLWCFTFADMPWYQHKLAAAIFSTPPSSTYDEALNHFEMAESLQPNFFSKNHLMLGKTYARLKKLEKAKFWLEKAANCVCRTVDDEQAKKEASELIKGL